MKEEFRSPSPIEEEFDDNLYALIDQYSGEFIGKGMTAAEFVKWCDEIVKRSVSFGQKQKNATINLREEVSRIISSPDYHIRIEAGEFKTAVFDFQKFAEYFYQLGKKHAAK